MTVSESVQAGRAAFAAQSWVEAHEHLSAADADAGLVAEDVERLAVADYLLGRDADSQALFERACAGYLDEGMAPQAARSAFWLGLLLAQRGETARGGGWLARAGRILDGQPDSAVQGYLLVPPALGALEQGDADRSLALFRSAADIGQQFQEADLYAIGRLGTGQALVQRGRTEEGLALLDDVMLSVQAEEVSPIPAGIIYCAVIEVCQSICDVRRAREWTQALTTWCERQPGLVPFRGQCLVHRAEVLQLQGAWRAALDEARRAAARMAEPPGDPALGMAHYRRGELLRLRGDLTEAEQAYGEASRAGHPPQPGLALLRLEQGEVAAAEASLRRALAEEHDATHRVRLLAALVEVVLAAGDVVNARAAADELADSTESFDAPLLRAMSAQATGAVHLAAGDAAEALPPLRAAYRAWQEIDAPYEAARVQLLLGDACAALGDEDGAALERDAARDTFTRLGATVDVSRLVSGPRASEGDGLLTTREAEVLSLVAEGLSNRAIADRLVISEHTVARHLQNIFTKLDVGSRTAAAAYAHTHGLAGRAPQRGQS